MCVQETHPPRHRHKYVCIYRIHAYTHAYIHTYTHTTHIVLLYTCAVVTIYVTLVWSSIHTRHPMALYVADNPYSAVR